MATSFGYIILICFIILVFQEVVDCNYINCYSCNPCGTSSSSWSAVGNLTGGNNYCFKDVGTSSTTRGASNIYLSGSDGNGGTYYSCLTDYCNGSVSLSNSLNLVFALITGVCVFKRVITN